MLRRLLPLSLLALAACEKPPVEWTDPTVVSQATGATRLVLGADGSVHFIPDSARVVTAPSVPGLCASSLRTVAGTAHLYAVWWNVRADSSAALNAAISADSGKTWGTAAAVDTSDVSSRGCSRPPPALASAGDDLYTAYSMTAPEGTGVFFAHFMGSMLHSPVAVIYGERIVPAAIAVDGDRVAVAYEEPNGARRQVDVALSSTQGHIFEWHETASRDVDVATAPAVALAGHQLAVAWITRRMADSAGSPIVRLGRIQ